VVEEASLGEWPIQEDKRNVVEEASLGEWPIQEDK
jgi:hypothetical protein